MMGYVLYIMWGCVCVWEGDGVGGGHLEGRCSGEVARW